MPENGRKYRDSGSCFVAANRPKNMNIAILTQWEQIWFKGVGLENQLIEDLYRSHAPRIYRRCLSILADPEEAMDATHEVFEKLQRKLSTFRGDASILSWIFRITTNHCLNQLRKRNIRQTVHGRIRNEDMESTFEMGSDIERRDLIFRLLKKHKKRHVQIVFHHYFDGLTQVEIAGLMGVSDRTVRKVLRAFFDSAKKDLARLEGTRREI